MAYRHLKYNKHQYAFIKDTLTINIDGTDSDEKVENSEGIKKLAAM